MALSVEDYNQLEKDVVAYVKILNNNNGYAALSAGELSNNGELAQLMGKLEKEAKDLPEAEKKRAQNLVNGFKTMRADMGTSKSNFGTVRAINSFVATVEAKKTIKKGFLSTLFATIGKAFTPRSSQNKEQEAKNSLVAFNGKIDRKAAALNEKAPGGKDGPAKGPKIELEEMQALGPMETVMQENPADKGVAPEASTIPPAPPLPKSEAKTPPVPAAPKAPAAPKQEVPKAPADLLSPIREDAKLKKPEQVKNREPLKKSHADKVKEAKNTPKGTGRG